MEHSQIIASYFQAVFYPDNQTLYFNIEGDSQVASDVIIEVKIYGYGYLVLDRQISPCDDPSLRGLCPMIAGSLPDLQSNTQIPKNDVSRIPSKLVYPSSDRSSNRS